MEGLQSDNTAVLGMSLVNIGFGVVIGAIAAIFGATLWMYRDRLKDAKAMLMILALLAILPMGAMLVQQRTDLLPQAAVEVTVVAIEAKMTGEKSALVYVTLSEPAFAYVEYKVIGVELPKTVVGNGKIEKRFGHSFEIKDIGAGGEIRVVVNGKPSERVVKLP